jgi:hypothetical protein
MFPSLHDQYSNIGKGGICNHAISEGRIKVTVQDDCMNFGGCCLVLLLCINLGIGVAVVLVDE